VSWDGFARVLPATARVNEAGHLEVGGCDALELVREHGTPLYVLDESDVRDRMRRYRDAFGGENVHYGAKAFLTRSFVPILTSEGIALDCATGGEIYTAVTGGFPAERILFHGNNKSADELTEALDAGVGAIVIDNLNELERLERVAGSQEVGVPILLRVTPGIEAHTHEYLKTGIEDTKFGVPIGDAALEVVRRAARAPHIEIVGLHAHIGSQVFDIEPFGEAARVMVRFLARVREATGLELPVLDLGGGLGIAYEPDDTPATIEDYAKVVLDAVRTEAERVGTPVPAVKVEPGRSIVGPTMLTLYQVGALKDIPGVRTYAAVDGGMSDQIRPALYGATYTFVSASRPDTPHDTTYAVAGRLCESGDVFRRDAMLPRLEDGDIVAMAATGAYGYAMASNYNREPRPAVVSVADGHARVLARRESYEDLVRLEG